MTPSQLAQQGKRVYAEGDDMLLKVGEYGIHPRIGWVARAPAGHMSDLSNHTVVEHEDGTITVSPSILVTGYDEEKREKTVWHGYLERGEWREV